MPREASATRRTRQAGARRATTGRPKRAPAGAMGRLLGAEQPARRGDAATKSRPSTRAGRGTYVEDRLRNDWLLELGRRRDWAAFARDFPRFRMNDDREVTLLRAADRAPRRQGRARRGARRLVRAARRRRRLRRCWRSTLFEARPARRRRRLAQGCGWRSRSTGRAPRAGRRRCSAPMSRRAVTEVVDEPGTLPRAQGRRRATALQRRADRAGAAAAGAQRRRGRGRPARHAAGSARCPADLAAWAWAGSRPSRRR